MEPAVSGNGNGFDLEKTVSGNGNGIENISAVNSGLPRIPPGSRHNLRKNSMIVQHKN